MQVKKIHGTVPGVQFRQTEAVSVILPCITAFLEVFLTPAVQQLRQFFVPVEAKG